MHNLIAVSLGLPGTPLHGLDLEPRARSTSAPLRTGLGAEAGPIARTSQRQPQAMRGRRFAARHRRPVPNQGGALLRQRS